MKHTCHCCNKEYDCGRDCAEPESDAACPECLGKMDVTHQTIECQSKEARMKIKETLLEVQFRLSACWRDGFVKHDVSYTTTDGFAVHVSLTKEKK